MSSVSLASYTSHIYIAMYILNSTLKIHMHAHTKMLLHFIQAAVKEDTGKTTCTKSRLTTVDIFVLKQFDSKVPKNNSRKQLIKEQRLKKIYISRDDDSACVEGKIKSAFNLDYYTILDCDKKGNLSVSPLKDIDGCQAIKRCRALYLCEVS